MTVTSYYPRCHAHLNVVLDGRGASDTRPLLVDTTPRAATVNRSGYAEADTWSLEFDARQLPFDPDLIRSMAVAIYMFNASSADDRREWAVPAYEMILGLCDEPELEISKDGQRVSMSGRDYTALLLDQEWDPRHRVPSGRPLDVTVQQMADLAAPPEARLRFDVEFVSNEMSSAPVVGASRRGTKKKGLWVEPGKSYWDVIYELAINEGFIAFVRGEKIIITDPRTQTEQSLAEAPRVAHGRDLSSLSVKRRLGKERVPQIEVVTRDHRTGKALRVRYPETHEAPRSPVASSASKTARGALLFKKTGIKDEIQRIVVRKGVRDLDTLKRIAKTRYENMARAEATYRFETRALEDQNGFDLLRLDAGTPVYVRFDPFNGEQMRALGPAQRAEHIRGQGYSDELAQFLSDHYERLDQFRQPHYIRSVEYNWSNTDGISIAAEAVNYSYSPRELAETAASA